MFGCINILWNMDISLSAYVLKFSCLLDSPDWSHLKRDARYNTISPQNFPERRNISGTTLRFFNCPSQWVLSSSSYRRILFSWLFLRVLAKTSNPSTQILSSVSSNLWSKGAHRWSKDGKLPHQRHETEPVSGTFCTEVLLIQPLRKQVVCVLRGRTACLSSWEIPCSGSVSKPAFANAVWRLPSWNKSNSANKHKWNLCHSSMWTCLEVCKGEAKMH